MNINAKDYTWQVILNPNAFLRKSSKFWKNIENKLNEKQIDYQNHITSSIDEAKNKIISLCMSGKRHFLVVGGDGSLNVFINAVMKSKVNSSEVYAAMIPIGTGNDWSRTLGYSNNYLDAIDYLDNGYFMNHDVGLIETVYNEKITDSRYFINIAGFGFDGEIIANVFKRKSKYFANQLYLINLLKTLLTYKPHLATLITNEAITTKNIFTLAVGIGQYNGKGMRQCPEAIPNDGLFDVVMIEKLNILKVILNIKNLFKGTHLKTIKEASMFRTNYLEIQSNPFIKGEVEGELLNHGYYRIVSNDSAINLLSASAL